MIVLESYLLETKSQAGCSKSSFSKAAGPLARGAYTAVREHDKGPRTTLAGFFNILLLGLPMFEILSNGDRTNQVQERVTRRDVHKHADPFIHGSDDD